MKKLALLALGATMISGAQAAVRYDHTSFNFGNYFPAQSTNPIADDLVLGNVGPVNNVILLGFIPTGFTYTGDIRVGLGNRTGLTVPPVIDSTGTVNVTLAGGFLWTVSVDVPTWTPAGTDIWCQAELLGNTGVATADFGLLIGGNPTIGSSSDNFAFNPGSGWAGNYWFGGTVTANFAMRVGLNQNTSITTTVGEEFAGDLASLDADDDNYYSSFNDAVSLANQMVLVADVNCIDPDFAMGYAFRYIVGRPGLACNVYLWNDSTNAWSFNQGFTANTVEEDREFETATAAEAANYVSADGQVKIRFDFAPINEEDPSQDGWLHSIEAAGVAAL
ncbi:MAG TPA: hypothetical protein PKA27_10070 [Fimbriimonadaceae bacterium]|nr:hypothetical protein [Fimbriimonadaceae bacterium]